MLQFKLVGQCSKQLHHCLDLHNLLRGHYHQEGAHAFDSLIAMVVTIGSGGGVGVTLVEAVGVGDQLLKGES